MTNFESERLELLKRRNELVKDLTLEGIKQYTEDFSKLFESVIFDLISSNSDFFGITMVNLPRKFNYCTIAPINHQIKNMTPVIHINPFKFIAYNKDDMKLLIIHELYQILGQHISRTGNYVGSVPNKLLVMASEMVAASMMQFTDGRLFYTFDRLYKEFSILIDENKTMEEVIESLKDAMSVSDSLREFLNNEVLNESDEDLDLMDILSLYDEFDLSLFPLLFNDTTDISLIEDFIRNIIIEANSISRGILPSGVSSILDELTAPPKISWQRVLLKKMGSVPYPYKKSIVRNDRRQPNRLDLRGRITDRKLKLNVAIDTSASLSDSDITYILNEIKHISKIYDTKATVIECDSQIQRVYTLEASGRPKSDIEGRGGTAFTPVIEYVNDNSKNINDTILIYFTDGFGETDIPVFNGTIIWVITGRTENLSVTYPQGKVLTLEDDIKYLNR